MTVRRILYLIDELVGFAGTERHLYYLAKQLAEMGVQPYVIAFRTNERMIRIFGEAGIVVEAFPIRKIYGLSEMARFWTLVWKIRGFAPDLVQTFHFMADTYGVAAARFGGVRRVISSRRDTGDLKKPRQVRLNRFFNRYVDSYIAVCEAVKRAATESEKIPYDRVTTIYNGLDTSKFPVGVSARQEARKHLGIPENCFVIGMVCIFRPEKDVLTFLQAGQELASRIPELQLVVGGTGQEKERLEKYVKDAGMTSIVQFLGYVHDVTKVIPAFDVACLTPRENEGLSNVLLEEMAMGKPVVATSVGGNAELIRDGETGFIIDPMCPSMLAERIYTLYQNESVRDTMGRKARALTEKQFSLEAMVNNHLTFYQTMVSGAGADA